MLVPASQVSKVCCIGTGSIGSGLIAHFLRAGIEVSAWDPGEDAEEVLRDRIDKIWPSFQRIGLATNADKDRWSFAANLEAACVGAEYVQESVPEDLILKQEITRRIDQACNPRVVIGSSTSGYPSTMISAECGPEGAIRCLIAHPFHPSHLVPLIEVVPGERSSPEAVAWTRELFSNQGKVAVTCSAGSHGFIANRLQAAILRESLHLVANGDATVEDIDRAVAYGPGLRWSFLGPFMTPVSTHIINHVYGNTSAFHTLI